MDGSLRNKIRLGLLIDSNEMPYWVYKMIQRLNESDYAQIVLVVKKKKTKKENRSFITRLQNNFHILLYILFKKWENWKFKQTPDAFKLKDIRTLLSNTDLIEVECLEKKFSDYVTENDIDKIKGYDIDIFLRLGFRILRGDILKTSKYGVWSYHHGDNHIFRGGPAGFWEVIYDKRELGSILQILTEDLDGGEVLYRSWSTVHTSLNETLNSFFWKTSAFIPRKVKELYETGGETFMCKVRNENSDLQFYSQPMYTIPGNFLFFRLFTVYFFKWITRRIKKIFYKEQWILLYSFNKSNTISTAIFRFKRILPPKDRYWADPCIVARNNRHYVFFEEVIYNGNKEKGHICVAEMGKNGFQSDPMIILDKPYHLSYPFVFEHDQKFYMIPESEQNSTIELYEAEEFPFKWKFKMNLMENVKAVDSTVLHKDNKFWLFTTIKEVDGGASSEELFLFTSDNLLSGKWTPHAKNPVISDVKSARPAGRIFTYNNKLYRPSQDCSFRYGYAMKLNEINTLTEDEYKESVVSSITPDWKNDVLGTHTFSYDKGLTLIDASIKRRRFF
ncbi:MAG TPA: hypothetical protein PKC72_04920 [Chitinophagaceae bacterium]|nr:hypothetical protein [Chitinophagaceae bacterium]